MKRILFLKSVTKSDSSTDQDWTVLQDGITHLLESEHEVEIGTFSELVFLIDGNQSRIWSAERGWDLADFDLVVFRRVGREIEKAISAAHYLHGKGVPFIDHYLLTQGKGKLSGGFMRAANGLPVPRTFFASQALYKKVFSEKSPFDYPFVLKADDGRKGYNNYLVHSYEELLEILQKTEGLDMISQQFIPNDGDMRILVLDERIKLVMLRKGNGKTHLNNTSQGGSAHLLPLDSLSPLIAEDCLRAVRLEALQVAGVDVIIDKADGRHYFLEVNRAPQLATGAFTDEKLRAYADMIDSLLAKKNPAVGVAIGRVEQLYLQAIKTKVPARIDTGARTSAIWASKIYVDSDDILHFTLFDKQSKYYTGEELTAKVYQETVVVSSNGVAERRYKVKLAVTLHGRRIIASFTLADRSNQVYPILVGRNLLNGKFLVNVRLGEPLRADERLRTRQLRRRLVKG